MAPERLECRPVSDPPAHWALPLSRGEAVAAFDSACLENRSPGTGGHAVSKPVVLGPFPGVGLVSPLHSSCPFCSRPVCGAARLPGRRTCRCPPRVLATHARRVPARPPGRTGRRRTGSARNFTKSFRGGRACSGPGRRDVKRSPPGARGPVGEGPRPLAARDPPVYRSSLPVRHARAATDNRVLLPQGHQTEAVGGRRTTFPDNPHLWICLWTILAAGWRRPW